MSLLQSAEAIGLELTSRLVAVRTANGCETDIGASVFRGKRAVDRDQIPCVAIVEGNDEVDELDTRGMTTPRVEATITQQYVLIAYTTCDPTNPNDAAHAAIRDMKRAVFRTEGKPDRTLGRKVKRVRYRGRDIGPRADGEAFVAAVLEVAVEYVEDIANP